MLFHIRGPKLNVRREYYKDGTSATAKTTASASVSAGNWKHQHRHQHGIGNSNPNSNLESASASTWDLNQLGIGSGSGEYSPLSCCQRPSVPPPSLRKLPQTDRPLGLPATIIFLFHITYPLAWSLIGENCS